LHEEVNDDRPTAKLVRNLGEKLTHSPRAEAVKMCHSALKRESGGGIESVMHVNASFEDAALHGSARAAISAWFQQLSDCLPTPSLPDRDKVVGSGGLMLCGGPAAHN
jgi:hypothetical protein